MQKHLNQGVCFNPEDLDVLKRAFDVLCAERGCKPGSPDAEATAVLLVNLFESGRTTEEELLDAARPVQEYRQAS